MKRMIPILIAGLLSCPALAQTTQPAPTTPAPTTPAPVAVPAPVNQFGVSLTAGINPSVFTVAVDYDVTPNINLRFGISPSPQVLELNAAYAFRSTPDWRVYGIAGISYRFVPSPEAWARVVGTLGIGLESPFFLFWNSPNRPPIWNRLEFGISSLNENGVSYAYSYPNGTYVAPYPGPGIFFRYGTVIRF
jgi:hypothetical protein